MKDVIYNFVSKFRLEKEITQEELAKAAGVTRQTIIAIEKGNYIPSTLLAIRLSHYFKKSVEEVFYLNKKMKNNMYEIILASVIILLLIFLINPFNLLMSSMVDMVIAVILILAFSIFSGLVWRENGGDEREIFHRLLADRIAFLAGSGIVIGLIIFEIYKHNIVVELVMVLVVMMLTKIFGLIYGKWKY